MDSRNPVSFYRFTQLTHNLWEMGHYLTHV